MDRKKFFREVRSFNKFRHSCVSDVSADEELICFVYTPRSASGEQIGDSINISIDLMSSPDTTRVFIGEKQEVFEKKYLSFVVNSLLQSLFLFFSHLSIMMYVCVTYDTLLNKCCE